MSAPLALSIYLSLFASTALGYVNVTRRVDNSEFTAEGFDVAKLYDWVKNGGPNKLATYPTCNDCDWGKDVDLIDYSDSVPGLFTFMADLDIDCDGINWQCEGNPDGQAQTNWGAMDTLSVPWYVIPNDFHESHGVVPNALGAVICNGKMFYAIFADSNGDTPQVIGETSLLLGNACFPEAGLSGNVGHTEADVAYIVFGSDAPGGVGNETIEFGPLKQLGDEKMNELVSKLNLGGGGGDVPAPPPPTDPTPPPPTDPVPPPPTDPIPPPPTDPIPPPPTDPIPPPPSGGGEEGGDPEVPAPPPTTCPAKHARKHKHKAKKNKRSNVRTYTKTHSRRLN